MEDKKELIDALNNLEIKYIKEYNSLCPNGYNVQKGGNCTEYIIHKCDVFEINPIYNNEVIIYKNKEYDIFTLSNELNVGVNDIAYDLVLGKNFNKYHFVNYDNLPFYGQSYPENATIKDIIDKKLFLMLVCQLNSKNTYIL